MQKSLTLVWFPKNALDLMISEATLSYPFETGGVLMGYVAAQGSELVVTDVIGPGPFAQHRRNSFVPDLEFQHSEIASRYTGSNRLHTYVGDWHTHPDGSNNLSRKDRNSLIRVARSPDARLAQPTMTIVAGGRDIWSVAVWQLTRHRIAGILNRKLISLRTRSYRESKT